MSEAKTTKPPLTTTDVVVWCATMGVSFVALWEEQQRAMVTGCADHYRRPVIHDNVTVYPTQARGKTSTRSANKKRYHYNRPTEVAAIARVTGDERRRVAREERLAVAEASLRIAVVGGAA